tara:strand:+ start:27413 stop:28414 length:1002 start_codon:yes stop_codon:yes gene_type:complete
MTNKIIISHVQTGWNLLLLLTYAKQNNFKKIIVLKEREIILDNFLHENNKVFESIEFHDVSTISNKIFYFLKIRKIKGIKVFLKFTNFSFFGQFLQKFINFKNSVFLDDGTVFLNILDKSITYTNSMKTFFKKLLWPKGYEPSFSEFKDVDVAYISNLSIVSNKLSRFTTKFIDVGDFFSYESMKYICDNCFSYEKEIDLWKKEMKEKDTLVLGSSLVTHNFINKENYRKIINSNTLSENFIYKPHPNEGTVMKDLNSSLVSSGLPNIPIEMFLVHCAPKKIISFGSTTSFWLKYSNLDIESKIFMIEDFFTPASINALDGLDVEMISYQEKS